MTDLVYMLLDWSQWLLGVWFECILLSLSISFIVIVICWYKCRVNKDGRIQWIEFHDESFCPNIFKQYLRRCIYEMFWKNEGGILVAKFLFPIIQRNNMSLILDCCSGSCGPSAIINQYLNDNNIKSETDNYKPIITILSDLYPQISSWKVFSDRIRNLYYSEKSIDATNIDMHEINNILQTNGIDIKFNSSSIRKARTIFGAFHHFPYELCFKIFEDAFKNKDIIIIGDGAAKKGFIDLLLWSLPAILSLPHATIQIIKFWLMEDPQLNVWQKICYSVAVIVLFPICLFLFQHDHIVSMARMYNKHQIMEMVNVSLNNINKQNTDDEKINYEFTYTILADAFGLLVCVPK